MRKKKLVGHRMSDGKKKWVKPMLTILTRGKDRQEMVLLACKGPGGHNWNWNECHHPFDVADACSTITAS